RSGTHRVSHSFPTRRSSDLIMDLWARMGVDGFRLDAIPYLCEREGTNCENLPETHLILKQIRAHMDARYQNRMLLAEANQWPEEDRKSTRLNSSHRTISYAV